MLCKSLLARSALTSILLQLAGSSENSTYQAVLEAVCFRLGQGCGRSREAAVLISAGDAKSASCCLVQLLLAAFDTVCSAVSGASLPFANKAVLQLHEYNWSPHQLAAYSCCILLMLALTFLQTLCTAVQHHTQLIRQLQQQMWACLGSAAQASSTAVLVGLQQQYMRTAGAMLSNAAPCSMAGR